MEYKNTLYEKSEGLATISINRPEALNAINEETILEILSHLDDAKRDKSVRVIAITGAGDRAFSAGADMQTWKNIDPLGAREFSRLGQRMCEEIEALEKPVIAAINGYALGGGLELAMACDLRIASEKARLGQTEINWGILPGWGGTQRLPRFVGKGVAKEMIFTGKMISAKDAEQLGLVNKVVPPDQLESALKELANELINKPPVGIKMVKELINSSLEIPLAAGAIHEAECFGVIASTEDFKEGLSAFLEKRKPKFKGK
jgi:enoyl-CoA hydratase